MSLGKLTEDCFLLFSPTDNVWLVAGFRNLRKESYPDSSEQEE
jgi:hypothetical protein